MERFQGPKRAPKTAQDRPKTGPRSSWIGFLTLDFLFLFFFVLGMVLVLFWSPKWLPRGTPGLGGSALGRVRIGPYLVWVPFCCCFVVQHRLFRGLGLPWGSFLVVLGSSWGRFLPLRGSFWCFFGSSTHRFNPSTHQLVDSTHRLINSSTHGPSALS